jgi:hypothetical protein
MHLQWQQKQKQQQGKVEHVELTAEDSGGTATEAAAAAAAEQIPSPTHRRSNEARADNIFKPKHVCNEIF